MRAIICIFLIFVCCIFTASALDDYDYYQSISYSACDQEIYQQDIVIHRTTGDPYEESSGGLNITHLYLNDHSQANYGDIRFTNPAGDELSYYLWSDFDSESAKFCVRLAGATSAGQMQVWYGNPAASTTSDGDATYLLHDHFDGASIDLSKWTETTAGITIADGIAVLHYDSTAGKIISKSTFGPNISVAASAKVLSGDTSSVYGCRPCAIKNPSGDRIDPYFGPGSSEMTLYADPPASGSLIMPLSQVGLYHEYMISRSPTQVIIYQDETKLGSVAYTSVSEMPIMIQEAGSRYSGTVYIDWVLVRAYSATPPTASDFSGEIYAGYVRSYPGYNIPTDPDADGLYEDVNGNGRLDFQDIMIFFQYNAWAKANQPKVECWDWSGNGAIEFSDVQAFWEAEFT